MKYIKNIYPLNYSISYYDKPNSKDIYFFKNTLVKYVGNEIFYFNNSNEYVKIPNSDFLNIFPDATNQEGWEKVVDDNSQNYLLLLELKNTMESNFANIMTFQLSPNDLSLQNLLLVQELTNKQWLNLDWLYMITIILSSFSLFYLLHNTNKKQLVL